MKKITKNQNFDFFVFCLYLVPVMSETCFKVFRHAKSVLIHVFCQGLVSWDQAWERDRDISEGIDPKKKDEKKRKISL